jgi:broad specificity phosphatase PhoE
MRVHDEGGWMFAGNKTATILGYRLILGDVEAIRNASINPSNILFYFFDLLLISISSVDSLMASPVPLQKFLSVLNVPRMILRGLIQAIDRERARFLKERMPNHLFLIRHGQSEGNNDPYIYQNTPDSDIGLTQKGKQQALEAGVKLRKIIGNKTIQFITSPYLRAVQTCHGVADAFSPSQYTIWTEPRLREQEWGTWGTENLAELYPIWKERRRQQGAFYYRFPQGESGADVFVFRHSSLSVLFFNFFSFVFVHFVILSHFHPPISICRYDRVTTFFETLSRSFREKTCKQNFVLISHGLTLRLIMMRYFHWSVEKFHSLANLENCQLVKLDRMSTRRFKLMTRLKLKSEVEPT